jgi:hypothetical protein
MNYQRIALAALAAWIAYFLVGGLVFGVVIAPYFAPYTAVYRPAAAIRGFAPFGMAGTFIALVAFAIMYA